MLRRVAFSVVVWTALMNGGIRGQTLPASRPAELDDKALDAVIAGLDNPATRYESFRKLTRFFWSYPHSSPSMMMSYGNKDLDARIDRAGKAMGKVATDALIKEALADSDRTMQWWALGAVNGLVTRNRGRSPDMDPAAVELLPTVRAFTQSDDEGLRTQAERALRYAPGEEEFLHSVLNNETSPENIMFMVSGTTPERYQVDMNAQLLRLLGSADAKVRARGMDFIASNSHMAEMFLLKLNESVVEKVFELASQEADRGAAAGALGALYSTDPQRILPIFQRLAVDKDALVRQQTARALDSHHDVPELRDMLAAMINDSDEKVRLYSIMGTGAKAHLEELRVMATSSDPDVASTAKMLLK